MKRAKRLYILLGVLAVLSVAAIAVIQREEHKEKIKDSGEIILQIPYEGVTALSWENESESLSFHKGEDGVWTYDEDEKFPVSEEKIKELLEPFEEFAAAFVIEEVEDYSQYGLNDPVCTIHLENGEQELEIKLGNFSNMDSQRYVSIGDGKAYLVKDDPLNYFDAVLKDMLKQDEIPEILSECVKAGNPDMVYKFVSTSKVSFPGSGIAAVAASQRNLDDFRKHMSVQTIGHDKVNQLRHVRFFKDIHGMVEHMRKHADIIRPKFEAVEEILERELGGLGIGEWTKPKGGYFISFDSLDGCAKDIVARCKKAGVVMTGAGATYPYGKDPHDSNIRIAPTYPPLGDLIVATELFALCVKLTSAEKLLKEMEQNPQPVKKKEADQQLPE